MLDVLEMALWRHDRGERRRVGRLPGDSYDNAMAESLNGTFKADLIKLHGPWRTGYATEIVIIEWIDWYNAVRLHGEIGDVPSAEHEADWYRHNPAAPAALTT